MDCIIQVFPDEYHLQSLEALLDTTSNLNHQVDIKNIFINLMDKLSKFAGPSNKSAACPDGQPEKESRDG
jgi:vacuolar protein sorting-associated protein 35